MSATRPNLLFIMSDDHAAHAIGCYGSRINATPQLDRLAAGGMRFDNCFCTNSICAPSRATILTGTHSHVNGVTTDKAKCYPPALRATVPGVEHRSSRYLKQRLLPMRGFKRAAVAGAVSRGHGLVQNLRNGFSALTAAIPRPLRLATAWPRLVSMI